MHSSNSTQTATDTIEYDTQVLDCKHMCKQKTNKKVYCKEFNKVYCKENK